MLNRVTRCLSFGAFGVLLASGACSDDESVFNAEVGECVESLSDLAGNVSDLPETDCSEAHEAEIFFLFEHEGDDDDFPGQTELEGDATEACEGDEFEDYTGVGYFETSIVVRYITPSEESWEQGDRETICVLALADGSSVDESFEDNGEDFPLGEGDTTEDTTPQDFSALIEDCEGGDNAACDQLYRTTPVGSEEERVALFCGGRSDEEQRGTCEATLG